MSDRTFELSRRKALIGLGTVGAASAGAGMGTSAYFSDEEVFDNNSLTAGELDLFVESHFSADQGSYDGMLASSETEVINGSYDGGHDPAEISYELDDVKPGDSGKLKFCFSIVDNPAYLWACGLLTGETAGNGGGHLADHLTATLRYFNKKDETPGDIIREGSFRDVLLALRNGVPLDSNGDASVSISDRMEYDGSEESDDYQEQALCIEWEFPIRSTQADPDMDNNDAQAASMEFDLSFYAEQARHNDGLTNPCVTSRDGEGFAKGEEELADPSWHARGRYGVGGGPGTRELDIRLPDDTPVHSGDDNYTWQNGDAVPFTLMIDGGDAKWNVDGTEVYVEDAPIPIADGIGVTAKASSADADIDVQDVRLNGSIPSGPDSVTTADDTAHIILEGATLQEGDEVTGMVEMSWDSGNEPSDEGIAFRVDV